MPESELSASECETTEEDNVDSGVGLVAPESTISLSDCVAVLGTGDPSTIDQDDAVDIAINGNKEKEFLNSHNFSLILG
jgi:glutamine cyclotransferase